MMLRILWALAIIPLILYFVPDPWCWVWVGLIAFSWFCVVLLKVFEYQIRNYWR